MNLIRVKLALSLFLTVTMAAFAGPSDPVGLSTTPVEELCGQFTVYWDDWGAAHIYAENRESLFFASGYIQSAIREGRIDEESNRLLFCGRASEVAGRGALEVDYRTRLFKVYEVAKQKYGTIAPETRLALESFCRGSGYFYETHKELYPAWFEPLEPVDLVAGLRQYMLNKEFDMNIRRRMGELPKSVRAASQQSNQWAVSPARSATGNAFYCGDPHVPWREELETHFNCPDLNFAGSGIGVFCFVGFNEHLAWSETTDFPDTGDVYIEKLNPNNPRQYQYEGKWRDMTVEHAEFRVKTNRGFETVTRELLYTHHGPVMATDEEEQVAYSVRLSLLDEVDVYTQYLRVAAAKSAEEFREAVSMRQRSTVNFACADVDGNIFYVWNSRCPVRDQKFDWLKPVPGWTAETEWQGFVPFEQLPQTMNPECGFVMNCNHVPWWSTTSGEIKMEQFPSYLFSGAQSAARPGSRAGRALDLLTSKEKFTLDDMKRFAMDCYVQDGRTLVRPLLRAYARASKSAPKSVNDLKEALELVRSWDGTADADSREMALIALYNEEVREGAKTDDKDRLEALRQAVTRLMTDHDTVAIPWEKVHGIERGEFIRSPGGLRGPLASLFMVHPLGEARYRDGKWTCAQGSSYLMVAELTSPPTVYTVKPYGNSRNPSSPHYVDLTRLYGQKQFKRFWFEKSDIMANLEEVWGTKISFGHDNLGYEAEIRGPEIVRVRPTVLKTAELDDLPDHLEPAGVSVKLAMLDDKPFSGSLRLRCDAGKEARPYVREADQQWHQCEATSSATDGWIEIHIADAGTYAVLAVGDK